MIKPISVYSPTRTPVLPVAHRLLAVLVCMLSLSSVPAARAEVSALADPSAGERLQQAAQLREQAEQRQAEADRLFDQRKVACQQEYLVNRCIEKARQENLAVRRETRRLASEGAAIEREVGKARQIERHAMQAEERRQQEASLEQRAATLQAEQAAAEQRRQEHLADKARKAEAGQKRRAAEAERHQRKVAERAARRAAAGAGSD